MQSCRPSLTRRASFFSPFLTHGWSFHVNK
jgi:hypothetical protein